MSGSSIGKLFTVTTWGESHGKGVGVVIDGCPAGISLAEEDIQQDLDKRKPGSSKYSTPRKESDTVSILSGIFEGKTTGTPISLFIPNTNQHSKDYSDIASYYRPGHADYSYDQKYGFRDYRGGGRSSGRETAGRVAAGAIAKKILKIFGVQFHTYTKEIGKIKISDHEISFDAIHSNPLYMPNKQKAREAAQFLEELKKAGNSAGGIVECMIKGVPTGLGEPVFNKLDACFAQAIMSIGAVKGFEIGDGFRVTEKLGSENNDFFTVEQGEITKLSNHAGGILGGISDGSPIVLRAAIKPTPSIHYKQQTVRKSKDPIEIQIGGRHDPIIVPRAVIVVEAMAAITLVDCLMQSMVSNIEMMKKALK